LPHASKSVYFLYAVPPVLRTRAGEKSKLAVRVTSRSRCRHGDRSRDLPSEVSQSLALELGLTVEQFNIWTEMEMAEFSILMHCRRYGSAWYTPPFTCANRRNRCERSMFVARDEHDAVNVLACPLSDCDHIWCKHCQQSIDPNGPRHSCDGTSELEHLVKEQGWKYCPCESPPACSSLRC
jgi:hypothetical protein